MPRKAKTKKDWTTVVKLADRLGITTRTIRRYRKSPGFPAEGTVADIEGWIARRDGKRPPVDATGDPATGGGDTSKSDGKPSEYDPTLSAAEVSRSKKWALMRQAEEDAKVTEMERRQKEGELVATADVMSMWTRIATGLKNDLLNIGAQARQKCAPLLRDPVDAGKVQDAVDEAVRRALEKAIEHGETA